MRARYDISLSCFSRRQIFFKHIIDGSLASSGQHLSHISGMESCSSGISLDSARKHHLGVESGTVRLEQQLLLALYDLLRPSLSIAFPTSVVNDQ